MYSSGAELWKHILYIIPSCLNSSLCKYQVSIKRFSYTHKYITYISVWIVQKRATYSIKPYFCTTNAFFVRWIVRRYGFKSDFLLPLLACNFPCPSHLINTRRKKAFCIINIQSISEYFVYYSRHGVVSSSHS